jgi:hypothetical protein
VGGGQSAQRGPLHIHTHEALHTLGGPFKEQQPNVSMHESSCANRGIPAASRSSLNGTAIRTCRVAACNRPMCTQLTCDDPAEIRPYLHSPPRLSRLSKQHYIIKTRLSRATAPPVRDQSDRLSPLGFCCLLNPCKNKLSDWSLSQSLEHIVKLVNS